MSSPGLSRAVEPRAQLPPRATPPAPHRAGAPVGACGACTIAWAVSWVPPWPGLSAGSPLQPPRLLCTVATELCVVYPTWILALPAGVL